MDCRIKSGNDDVENRSRDTFSCPSLANHDANRLAPGNKRGRRSAERRMPTIAAAQTSGRNLPNSSAFGAAARHIGARPPSGASTAALAGTPIPAQLQAMLPATWNQAGVTRPILSQSSDSTSRLGRSAEGNDAQSRSGADCESARKHRTRSTLRIASGMRPSMSEILRL
jgi:hypothetical protein